MDFNDGSPNMKMTPKQLAIIAGGVILGFMILFFVIRLVRGGSDQTFQPSLKDQRETIEKTCDRSENKEICIQTLSEQAAIQNGQAEFCEGFTEAAYDGCVWEVALKTKDVSVCERIVNASYRLLCGDEILYDSALTSGDSDMCAKIKDETKRAGCIDGLNPVTTENCIETKKDPALCQMLSVSLQAAQKQDRRICRQLEGDFVQFCEERVLTNDPDFDGLSTDQELYQYKTNPDKSDTDGDGYNDGDEVAAGYNPNGTGKLE